MDDIEQGDIWGELESEFSSSNSDRAPEPIALPYLVRRTTFLDRFDRAAFNGYAITCVIGIAALWVNSFYLSSFGLGAHINISSLLPALLVAGLIAPVFGGERKPLWYYLLAAPIASGTFCILSALMDIGVSNLVSTRDLSPLDLYTILQSHLEAFLSVTCVMASIVGMAVAVHFAFKRQRQLPWFETSRFTPARRFFSMSLALIPLLAVFGLQIEGYLTSRQSAMKWFEQTREEYRNTGLFSPQDQEPIENAWSTLRRNWISKAESRLGHSSNLEELTPQDLLWEVESKFLDLLKNSHYQPKDFTFHYNTLTYLLLSRLDDLKSPRETLLKLLEVEGQRLDGWSDIRITTKLTELLSERRFSDQELRETLISLQAWRASRLDQLPRLDLAAISSASETHFFRYSEPESLRAFEFFELYSPTQMYTHRKMLPVLKVWLELRESLAERTPEQVAASLSKFKKSHKDSSDNLKALGVAISQTAEETVYSLAVTQTAEIACAIRLYQNQHGKLPQKLADIQPLLDFDPQTVSATLHQGGDALELEVVVYREKKATWAFR